MIAFREMWIDNVNGICSIDAIASHQDGRIKILLDSAHLKKITPWDTLCDGSLVLEDSIYESLEGPEFTKKELSKYCREGLYRHEEDIKNDPVWQILARDKSLLYDYIKWFLSEGVRRFGGEFGMGTSIPPRPKSQSLKSWHIDSLQYLSNIRGCDLDSPESRIAIYRPNTGKPRGYRHK